MITHKTLESWLAKVDSALDELVEAKQKAEEAIALYDKKLIAITAQKENAARNKIEDYVTRGWRKGEVQE